MNRGGLFQRGMILQLKKMTYQLLWFLNVCLCLWLFFSTINRLLFCKALVQWWSMIGLNWSRLILAIIIISIHDSGLWWCVMDSWELGPAQYLWSPYTRHQDAPSSSQSLSSSNCCFGKSNYFFTSSYFSCQPTFHLFVQYFCISSIFLDPRPLWPYRWVSDRLRDQFPIHS